MQNCVSEEGGVDDRMRKSPLERLCDLADDLDNKILIEDPGLDSEYWNMMEQVFVEWLGWI